MLEQVIISCKNGLSVLFSLPLFIFLQELLKKVYQESCRILTLSQRRATSSSQPHVSDAKTLSLDQTRCQSHENATPLDRPDKWSSAPPLGWQQEKRALQETVIALRELLCRMAQRDTQVSSCLVTGFNSSYQVAVCRV